MPDAFQEESSRQGAALGHPMVATIFEQPDAGQISAQHTRVIERLLAEFSDPASMLIDADPDVLPFAALAKEHWRHIWSQPAGPARKGVARRTDVVGIVPNRSVVICLVGAVLGRAEQRVSRRPTLHVDARSCFATARMTAIDGEAGKQPEIEHELAEVS